MEVQSLLIGTAHPFCLVGSIKRKHCRVFSHQTDPTRRTLVHKAIQKWKHDQSINSNRNFTDWDSLVQTLCQKRMPNLAHDLLIELQSEGFLPDNSTLSSVMLCYAHNGHFPQARAIWDEMMNSSFVPSIQLVSELINAYGKMGLFNEVAKILDQVGSRNLGLLPEVYSVAISCLGKGGQLELMENTLKEMISKGFSVESATGNAFIRYYSIFGSLTEMEGAYGRLKRSRFLIEEEGIRAMSFAYIRERKFYRLGEFLRDVGLGRKNVGNLIWNLLLLSYAANFKMKSLQREFLKMLEAGFTPDVTTFNIRALAFSRMSLFWDLHLSIEHMNYEKVSPDLVTYGCVIDAYLEKRLGRNLDFALNKMNLDTSPAILTDSFVFEGFGKGDFHSSSDVFLEFNRQRKWTYRELIAVYLRKQYRRNQIFWNY